MIDHLFKFTTEADAKNKLSVWVDVNADTSQAYWKPKPKCGLMPVKIVTQEAVYNEDSNGDMVLASPEIFLDGWWLAIACETQDEALWAIPECVLEVDRNTSSQTFQYMRTKLSAEIVDTIVRITPTFA
ncbi:MAG: hypothetical protein AAF228_06250 [Pseudomonadota bacterium]